MQAIFGFAGGNSRLLANLHREMPIKVINLPINYRCSGAVVEIANAIADASDDSVNPFYKPMIAVICAGVASEPLTVNVPKSKATV